MSNGHRIKRLNADRVDGKDAGQLGVRTRLYRSEFSLPGASGFQVFLRDVPRGRYLSTYAGYFFGPNSGGTIECVLLSTVGGPESLHASLPADGPENFYGLHSADVTVVGERQDLIARCTGDDHDWFGTIRVSLTPIDRLTRVSADAGPA